MIIVERTMDISKLWTLENEFLNEIGEEPMTEAARKRLAKAMAEERIIFFIAREEEKPVGMCSVSPCFSTFACQSCGVFDDFYVKPAYRKQGVARQLVNAVQAWCKSQEYASIMVGCSAGDIPMYRSIGFDTELGIMLVNNL